MDSFTVVIEPDEDAYHASVPALPGCHTFGETVDAALLFINEAIALYLEENKFQPPSTRRGLKPPSKKQRPVNGAIGEKPGFPGVVV